MAYDGLDRLTSTTGGSGIDSSSLTYDGLGNITQYTSKGASLDYTYDLTLNRLTSVNDTIGSKHYSFANGYDGRGNVIKNGSRNFTYNLANQMVGSNGNSYLYDGHNRRIRTQDSHGTSYSMYSQAGKLLYRETKDGGINYIFLGDKLIAKEGVMPVPTNSRRHYKPFGDSIEAPKDEVGYTGHKFDTDLGWSYMQARYMDPVLGRFMSNDPVGFRDIHSFNRYVYANNNPYKYVDPDGNNAVAAAQIGYGIGSIISSGITAATGASLGVHIYNAVHNESTDNSFDTDNPKNSNPLQGEPGSCSECNNKNGNKKQKRHYGEDGFPAKDEDYDHSHKGVKPPHVHDWDRPEDGSPPTNENRGEARKPEPGEIKIDD